MGYKLYLNYLPMLLGVRMNTGNTEEGRGMKDEGKRIVIMMGITFAPTVFMIL